MKIKIISDQHLDRRSDAQIEAYLEQIHASVEADICVIAGDFDEVRGATFRNFARVCSYEKHVIYVPGNHDYYGRTPVDNIDIALEEIASAVGNMTILRPGRKFPYMGYRFLGDTMWVRPTQQMHASRGLIADTSEIPDFWRDIPGKNLVFQKFLDQELTSGDIVVTHHLPSEKSTPREFLGSPLQPWFVCDQEALIKERKPLLWVHGHTHARCSYRVGHTQIVCNPLGYPYDILGRYVHQEDLSKCLPCIVEVKPPEPPATDTHSHTIH